jgi:hypothetical protein
MVRRHLIKLGVTAAFAVLLAVVPAAAEEPPHVTFSPAPPGSVVQSQLVYLSGEAMHTQWRAVASKKLLGSQNATDFYQWYLSIYFIDDTTYRLKYRSPANGGPLSRVTQPSGAKVWFPIQQLKIVGAAELMQPAVQQLVVQSHEMAADCGASVVTVFTSSANGTVAPAVSVRNGCELAATIIRDSSGDAIELSGPYYGANAALCCPTKPHATATLRYRNGAWSESPNYFPLFAKRFPPE